MANRRPDALSRERIISAAVALLDAEGAAGLTFRLLSAHLKTGPGAIYWHVANKDELLAACTGSVLGTATAADPGAGPQDAIRAIALGVFDAFDAHPWIGGQLVRPAAQPTTMQIFERIGQRLQALGVAEPAQFDYASALLNYIVGVAAQNAARAQSVEWGTDRAAVLRAQAARWAELDAESHPFARTVAAKLATHDDRDQYLAGVNLILAGIHASP